MTEFPDRPSTPIEDEVRGLRLFEGLAEADVRAVAAHCHRIELAEDVVVAEQGDPGRAMFLVARGELAVVRRDGDVEVVVNNVGSGQDVGIMALFDGGLRTATLRTTRPTVVYRLDYEDFSAAFGDSSSSPFALMLRNELRMQTEFLKSGNEASTAAYRREFEESRRRLRFGSFVAFLIGSVTLYAFLLRIFLGSFVGRIDSTFITAGILVGCLLIYVPMMRRSGFPMATYGLTLVGWRRSVAESLGWTAGFLLVVTGLKAVLLQVVPSWQGQPLFSFYGFTRYPDLATAFGLMGIYCVLAPVQELIARGAMQSSLHEFLTGPRRDTFAILLSTLMFAQIHLHLNPSYAIAVFLPSLFWGALYARHRTLVGVSISHILIGVYVAFFLGLPMMVHR